MGNSTTPTVAETRALRERLYYLLGRFGQVSRQADNPELAELLELLRLALAGESIEEAEGWPAVTS